MDPDMPIDLLCPACDLHVETPSHLEYHLKCDHTDLMGSTLQVNKIVDSLIGCICESATHSATASSKHQLNQL